jgi:predicted DNA-binding antitoxin AbrB/MazE fold protein
MRRKKLRDASGVPHSCCDSPARTRILRGSIIIAIVVEAVYENGVIKPARALPLREHQKVQLTVESAVSRVRQTAGLIGWTGSQEDADFVALSPELD